MKRFFTSLVAASLAFGAVAASQIFSVDLSTAAEEDFAAWTVLDINSDGSTWVYSADAAPSRVYYSYNSANSGDDWLISPAVNIPADGTYVISYTFKGSSYGEAFEVWTGDDSSVEGMKELVATHDPVLDNEAGNLVFVDAKAGPMYIGFHCVSAPDKFRLYINNVSVLEASNPVDLRVAGFVSPVSGENMGEETVTVQVENLGKVDMDSFDVAYSVDGMDPVVEHVEMALPMGETVSYSFAAKADLSVGHKTYALKAWTIHPDDLNPANDAAEAKVRHIAPATVPYFMGFEPDEDTSGITFLNLNNDSGDWGINIDGGWFGSFARTGYGCLAYNYDKENAGDDWAFLEPVKMKAGHYVFRYWYSATDGHPERLRVCYGTQPTPEAMTTVIAEYDPLVDPTYKEAIHIIDLKEDADIYFGFYSFSDADENWICIDDVSIEEVDANSFDMIVGEISSPAYYLREGNIRDVAFSLQNVGIVDAVANINISIDGAQVYAKEYAIRAMELLDMKIAGLLDNIQPGVHTMKVEALCDADNNLSNNVQEIEFKYVTDAVKLWDFEDGQLPDDLTYRVEDSAVNHPDTEGTEFNEDGFGIFALEHPVLGHHALAVNTWFTEDRSADRWIVLPQITVTGEDACFIWNANSYNPKYLEKYDVKVSKSDDVWYNYSTELSVSSENIMPQTRGIDLGKYNGEKIYVAVNVRTTNGEAMILDNFGLYGDVQIISTGVGITEVAPEVRLSIEGDMLRVLADDVKEVILYTMDGSQVARSETATVSLASLPKGMFVARVHTADGSVTVKFAK
jgi:hypothetical protein